MLAANMSERMRRQTVDYFRKFCQFVNIACEVLMGFFAKFGVYAYATGVSKDQFFLRGRTLMTHEKVNALFFLKTLFSAGVFWRVEFPDQGGVDFATELLPLCQFSVSVVCLPGQGLPRVAGFSFR